MSHMSDAPGCGREFIQKVGTLSTRHRQDQIRPEVRGGYLPGAKALRVDPARGELARHL